MYGNRTRAQVQNEANEQTESTSNRTDRVPPLPSSMTNVIDRSLVHPSHPVYISPSTEPSNRHVRKGREYQPWCMINAMTIMPRITHLTLTRIISICHLLDTSNPFFLSLPKTKRDGPLHQQQKTKRRRRRYDFQLTLFFSPRPSSSSPSSFLLTPSYSRTHPVPAHSSQLAKEPDYQLKGCPASHSTTQRTRQQSNGSSPRLTLASSPPPSQDSISPTQILPNGHMPVSSELSP